MAVGAGVIERVAFEWCGYLERRGWVGQSRHREQHAHAWGVQGTARSSVSGAKQAAGRGRCHRVRGPPHLDPSLGDMGSHCQEPSDPPGVQVPALPGGNWTLPVGKDGKVGNNLRQTEPRDSVTCPRAAKKEGTEQEEPSSPDCCCPGLLLALSVPTIGSRVPHGQRNLKPVPEPQGGVHRDGGSSSVITALILL